ncbi:MAG: hypothetical protein ACR2MX_05585 [Cyclobacteriaceae bacterium]
MMSKGNHQFADAYRQHPNQAAIDDFEKLNVRLQSLLDATQKGNGQTLRLTFEVPLEYVMLASWLGLRKYSYQTNQSLPRNLSDMVEMPPNNHDLKSAWGYMGNALDEFFMKEYHDLCTHYHLSLYERPTATKVQSSFEDEDLPF